MLFDPSTAFGARVERRLKEDRLAWLTTVRADGTPEPSPIWFLWDGQEILIYSRRDKVKLANIEQRPRVAFNFDGDGQGGNIVILTGEARLVPDEPPADQNPVYARKYEQGFERIGMSAGQFAKTYSVAIRIRPTRLRGH
jgi:PPOX class probable F420-dependent enzyme